ncbi:PREDICTED: protein STICHEL-like 3 [Tarenaya hassleriana]|uniref:protein STICHEL-like 3 n=1 Tax=Tarenaya hassleriana TaxID=28532 RepID=UPI00053C1FE0|nr:PREDICTED: protein STICHEL-like 3 [Tarenaya hassleriana]
MTRAGRNRILKDSNGDIGDHLRNHIHLTNCIHLKNHMHKQSPALADRALMRDLIVLQRSRSLRDPSASPPAWHSPSVVDLLPKKGDSKDLGIREGRRSVDQSVGRKSSRRLSGLGSSPPVVNFGTSKVTPSEEGFDGTGPVNEPSSESGVREGSRRVKREESSRKSYRVEDSLLKDQNLNDFHGVAASGNSGSKDRGSKTSGRVSRHDHGQVKTLSDQLNQVRGDSDDDDVVVSSNVRPRVRYGGDGTNRGCSGGATRSKRRKFRGTRRGRNAITDNVGKSEMSVASNQLSRGSGREKYEMENEEGEEYGEQKNMARAPQKGCGIPFNWSRIHHRGKTFLDMAGRSFSCGMSDSRMRKGESNADMPMMHSDDTSSFTKSDADEALPLLVDSADNDGWVHDYSGELGIFADNLLKKYDSDLSSEARSGEQRKNSRRNARQHHHSLTQKYMPRTFRDLVGQNLVVQALSNAVSRRKVGLLYVFHGPHGTGKTSCARILAKALNCQSSEHPKPCCFCSSCVSHDSGKSRNIREVGPVGNFDFEGIMDLLDNMTISHLPMQYRVFIFDDCDTLSPDCWSAVSKVVDRAPRSVVFILVCSSLDVLPHMIISRCQKFFFPKLKDADIINTLQWIASKEGVEIEKDALKLIASRSDGSLRDAEMTLEQLSLLGQRISVPLVQELAGLISDEKLVDLLDLALSADTVNTVKNLRIIMETGVEPLALMSQLATIITDILAGSYDFAKDRHRRKFFRRQPLSKEDMEKLRQALKTLSEAEKQLRVSNDKPTWLTAALLQLAPDPQYLLPTSPSDTGLNRSSPLALDFMGRREASDHRLGPSGDATGKSFGIDRRRDTGSGGLGPIRESVGTKVRQSSGGKNRPAVEEIWLEVIEKIQVNGLREFLYKEGKIVSVSLGAAPTVQLTFSSPLTKSTAEKFRGHILQAFEAVLGSPVTIEIRNEARKESRTNGSDRKPLSLPPPVKDGQDFKSGRSEIVEVAESPGQGRSQRENTRVATSSCATTRARRRHLEASQSIVRGKVSLANVIQRAEGCTRQNGGWSKRNAMSIAEKLEQENLRLEPRSRSLLCWKASRATRRKISRLKVRRRRRAQTNALMKLVSCGQCLSTSSTVSR